MFVIGMNSELIFYSHILSTNFTTGTGKPKEEVISRITSSYLCISFPIIHTSNFFIKSHVLTFCGLLLGNLFIFNYS